MRTCESPMKPKIQIILHAMLSFSSLTMVSCGGISRSQETSPVRVHLGEMVSKPGMYWVNPQETFWNLLEKCGGPKPTNEIGATILGGVTIWRKEHDGTLLVRKWWTGEVAPNRQTVQRLLEDERQGRWKYLKTGDRVYFIDQRTIP